MGQDSYSTPPPPGLPPAAPPPAAPPPAAPPPPGPGPSGAAPGGWAPSAPLPAAPVGAMGLRYGGTPARFLAYVLDGFLIGIVAAIVGAIVSAGVDVRTAAIVQAVVVLGLEAIYFIGFWTSGAKATLGMRLFNLQVGNAADGAELTLSQAVIRWFALGLPFQALSLLPAPLNALGGLSTIWAVILLISTIASPTKQGIHDRLARSVMVQPIGREGPVVPCLVLFVVLLFLPIVAILGLIFIGGQISSIVTTVSPAP